MAEAFHIHILAADRDFYQGQCVSLVLPTSDGSYGVLANHVPIVTAIVPGELTCQTTGGQTVTAVVSSGMARVENNDVLVLVGAAEKPEEIDEARARRAAERARAELLQKHSWHEHLQTQANLNRALTRLKAAGKH